MAEVYTTARAAYQSDEVNTFDATEPAIMAAVATCLRNGAWGSELECAELNKWLDMHDIELRFVSSESRVADVRSSRALVALLYRQGAHFMAMSLGRFRAPVMIQAAA